MIILRGKMKTFCVVLVFMLKVFFSHASDKPCAAREIKGQSVICVCNTTYCDEITREDPLEGNFITYTSSEGGLRFYKSHGKLENSKSSSCCSTIATLDLDTTYQTIEGFGGAVTDAAGINWKTLSPITQQFMIDSYFGENGLEYNMLRVPIGGSDFSTHAYAYNEYPINDTELTNYTLSVEDNEYKLPMIKSILTNSNNPVKIVATTWSPPVWMKTNNAYYGFSRLKEEYYQTYADYHLRFIEKYAVEGVDIWAITTTNEPINGVVPLARFNSLGWTPGHMGKWILNNLGPTIRNSTFSDVLILGLDDQRYSIPLFFEEMIKKHPAVLQYVDGMAVHYYGDFLAPASFLSNIPERYPGKFVLATEACEGSFPWQIQKVLLGSWQRANNYIVDILEDLNHNVVGWIDWNLCLNPQGGPNWSKNFVDSPIIIFPERDEFIKQPMFYAMGHFSKFIPRGSKRVKVSVTKHFFEKSLPNVAFLTPQGNVVTVLYNNDSNNRRVALKLGNKIAQINLIANSINTVILSKDTLDG